MPASGTLDAQTSQYESDFNVSTYSADNGLLVLPVMGPAGTPAITIRMHGGFGYRNVKWSYKKRGTPPIMPAMQDTQSGDIFLGADISVPVPSIGGDETMYEYVAAGEYEFLQGTLRGSTSNFQTGRKPYQSGLLAASIAAANMGQFVPNATLQSAATIQGYSVLSTNPNFGPDGLVPVDPSNLDSPPLAGAPLTPPGWVNPVGNVSIMASAINFGSPNYQYFDTGISNLFFSQDLII